MIKGIGKALVKDRYETKIVMSRSLKNLPKGSKNGFLLINAGHMRKY